MPDGITQPAGSQAEQAPDSIGPSSDPTATHPVAYRSPNPGEYILSVFLQEGIGLEALQRLARCSDRARVIREALVRLEA